MLILREYSIKILKKYLYILHKIIVINKLYKTYKNIYMTPYIIIIKCTCYKELHKDGGKKIYTLISILVYYLNLNKTSRILPH